MKLQDFADEKLDQDEHKREWRNQSIRSLMHRADIIMDKLQDLDSKNIIFLREGLSKSNWSFRVWSAVGFTKEYTIGIPTDLDETLLKKLELIVQELNQIYEHLKSHLIPNYKNNTDKNTFD